MASRFYAVRVGREPGVYTDWPACQRQVHRYSGAKYRSFRSRLEAEQFVADTGSAAAPKRRAPDASESEPDAKRPCAAAPADPEDGPLIVYTDGSCLSNGTPQAKAGVGVWFGPEDPRYVGRAGLPHMRTY